MNLAHFDKGVKMKYETKTQMQKEWQEGIEKDRGYYKTEKKKKKKRQMMG